MDCPNNSSKLLFEMSQIGPIRNPHTAQKNEQSTSDFNQSQTCDGNKTVRKIYFKPL